MANEARALGASDLAVRLLELADDLEPRIERRLPVSRRIELAGVLVQIDGLPRELTHEHVRRLCLALSAAAVD